MPTTTTTTTETNATGTTTATETVTIAEAVPPRAAAAAAPAAAPVGKVTQVVTVTGAGGFIGTEVVSQLLAKGVQVNACVRKIGGPKYAHLEKLAAVLPGTLKFFEADLTAPGSFDKACEGAEYVHHIASPFDAWNEDPDKEIIDPAINGTINVLQAVAKARCVRRVVLTSSVFGCLNLLAPKPPENSATGLYDEADWNDNVTPEMYRDPAPETRLLAYGISKPMAEKKAWELSKELGIDLVTICPAAVFGPQIGSNSLSNAMLMGMMAGEPNPFLMNAMVPAVDVRDVARAHMVAAEKPEAEGRYIISLPDTANQLTINKILNKNFPMDFSLPEDLENAPEKPMFDTKKCNALIGPLIGMNEMVADTARAMMTLGQFPPPT